MQIQGINTYQNQRNKQSNNQPMFLGFVSYTPKMPPIFDGVDRFGIGNLSETYSETINQIYANLYKSMKNIIPLKDIKEVKGFNKVRQFKLGDDIITLATDPESDNKMGNEIKITHGKDGCEGTTKIYRYKHTDPEFDELAQTLDKKPMPD